MNPWPDENTGDTQNNLFAELNITPFTDVILVLLVIFMVSSSAMVDAAREGQLELQLPKAGTAKPSNRTDKSLLISLQADGQLFLDQNTISEKKLQQYLHKLSAEDPQVAIIVDADSQIPHGRVVEIIDMIRSEGIYKVGIGTLAKSTAP